MGIANLANSYQKNTLRWHVFSERKRVVPLCCIDTFTFYQYDAQFQNIPASEGNHLGFVWGPGDIMVYDTIYKSSGV